MKTSVELNVIPGFDEIVFENRNKEYGAYILRSTYRRNVTIAVIFAVIIATLGIILPYMKMKSKEAVSGNKVRIVQNLVLSAIDPNIEKIALPEIPKPKADLVKQAIYVPPVVVDTVGKDDFTILTTDDAQDIVRNRDITEIPLEVPEEIIEEKVPEPFYKVEEMPMFPGGDQALLKFVYDNVVYPQIAIENNIQGRVVVKFCVTPTGGVNQISILKGVDPEIDKEVIRVVSIVPLFKPGKQGGKPVPVWYILPVTFKLTAG